MEIARWRNLVNHFCKRIQNYRPLGTNPTPAALSSMPLTRLGGGLLATAGAWLSFGFDAAYRLPFQRLKAQ